MNVAIVIEWLEARRGGAETSTKQFLRHLAEHGVDVTVITRGAADLPPGVGLCIVPAEGWGRAQAARRFVRLAWAAAKGGFDLVHAISPCPGAQVYEPRGGTVAETVRRNLALRRAGPPRVLKQAVNRLNLKQQWLFRLEREWLGGADRPTVIALSDYVMRQLREHYDYPPALIRKVFNGADPDPTDAATRRRDRETLRQRHGIGTDELLAVMVAHNFKLKGLRRWIEALALLRAEGGPAVRSLVAGRDGVGPWRRLAERRGVGGMVRFLGAVGEVGPLLHAADLLVHPTYYDPCSRVVLESLAAGLPVVTTRYDGAAEMIEPGVNGWVVEEADCVAEIAAAVRRLADPTVRERMGRAAAKTAERVSMARHAAGVLQVYEDVMGTR